MGLASLAGRTFRLDPTSISWDFDVKVSDKPTVGGKVVQVYGTSVSDIVVSGSFGKGGWQEQEKFLEAMKKIGDAQVAAYGQMRTTVQPDRFLYPPRGWDFLVYLKDYSDPAGAKSIALDNTIFAPRWTLTLFVVEDNAGLRKVSQDAYISRLAKGLGWKGTNEYNGPGAPELGGMSVQEYIANEFGISGDTLAGNQEGGGDAAGGGTVVSGAAGTLNYSQLAQVVKNAGLSGENGAIAIAIAMAESTGNPRAHNPRPPDNSYGLWQINMLGSMGPARRTQFRLNSNEDLFDPATNARAMMGISSNGSNWRPWSTFTNGAYRKYLSDARAAMGI